MKQADALAALNSVVDSSGHFGCWLTNGAILACKREGTEVFESGILVAFQTLPTRSFFVWSFVLGLCSEDLRRSFQYEAMRQAQGARA